jgi:hypothetical protein
MANQQQTIFASSGWACDIGAGLLRRRFSIDGGQLMKYVFDGETASPFDRQRLHGSVTRSCLAVRLPDGAAEDVASRVLGRVNDWLAGKTEVTSLDVHEQALATISELCPDAADYYQMQREII